MDFDDIEMLNIPDDSSLTLSPTDSMGSANSSQNAIEKKYPLLQDWLHKRADLEFQFDPAAYKSSTKQDHGFYSVHANYITAIYKVTEELTNSDVQLSPEDDDDGEPLGLVTTLGGFGKNSAKEAKISKINQAFSLILDNYRDFVDAVKDDLHEEDVDAYYDLQSLLECIYANVFPSTDRQRPELITSWINKFDPKPDNDLIEEIIYNTPTPYLHPQFWTTYMGELLTRGMFEQASMSLKSSKYSELEQSCPQLHAIISDFETLVSSYTSMALKGQFPEWKRTACEMRDNYKKLKEGITEGPHVVIASQVRDLLGVITGLPKTISSFVSTWYELYAALSLYQVRDDDDSVYDDYYKLAVKEKGTIASDIEDAFHDLFHQSYLRVILAVDRYDPPTAAYVSKLFELRGLLRPYYEEVLADSLGGANPSSPRLISDYLLIRHSFECLESHQLVPVALGILIHPIVSLNEENIRLSKEVVDRFLPHYKCYTNDDMEWALTICSKLDLSHTVKKLYLQQGERSLDDGHLYEAMNMLANCYDEFPSEELAIAMKKIHYIVWEVLFATALLQSKPFEDELIQNFITRKVDESFVCHPLIRLCLAPYAVFVEYLQCMDDPGAFSKKLSRIFHLIRFKFIPKKFVPLLFAQLLPLFEEKYFKLQDLIVIIELIDAFEALLAQKPEEISEPYHTAVEQASTVDVASDWRCVLKVRGAEIPPDVTMLIKTLRESIVVKIGKVYINQQ